MINTADAKVLLVGDRYLDLIGRIRPRLNVNEVVSLGEGDGTMYRLSELARRTEPDETEAEVEEEDVSVLMYTSGTTSLPKGVMLRFRDFVAYVTANVEMADGTDLRRGAGVRAVLPHRRNHRDDDQHLDRPQSYRDAAVRSEEHG